MSTRAGAAYILSGLVLVAVWVTLVVTAPVDVNVLLFIPYIFSPKTSGALHPTQIKLV